MRCRSFSDLVKYMFSFLPRITKFPNLIETRAIFCFWKVLEIIDVLKSCLASSPLPLCIFVQSKISVYINRMLSKSVVFKRTRRLKVNSLGSEVNCRLFPPFERNLANW